MLHTPGEDDEEVNLEDLKDRSGETKDGYKKLRFCGRQAYNTSGWTPAVLINRATGSFQKLSTLCFAGIASGKMLRVSDRCFDK